MTDLNIVAFRYITTTVLTLNQFTNSTELFIRANISLPVDYVVTGYFTKSGVLSLKTQSTATSNVQIFAYDENSTELLASNIVPATTVDMNINSGSKYLFRFQINSYSAQSAPHTLGTFIFKKTLNAYDYFHVINVSSTLPVGVTAVPSINGEFSFSFLNVPLVAGQQIRLLFLEVAKLTNAFNLGSSDQTVFAGYSQNFVAQNSIMVVVTALKNTSFTGTLDTTISGVGSLQVQSIFAQADCFQIDTPTFAAVTYRSLEDNVEEEQVEETIEEVAEVMEEQTVEEPIDIIEPVVSQVNNSDIFTGIQKIF